MSDVCDGVKGGRWRFIFVFFLRYRGRIFDSCFLLKKRDVGGGGKKSYYFFGVSYMLEILDTF